MRITLFVCLVLAGCTVVADTGRFEEDAPCDMELKLRNFAPHVGQFLEARLTQVDIDGNDARLLLRASFDPYMDADVDLRIPLAVPPLQDLGRQRPQIDFFADFGDANRVYDGQPTDHSWTLKDACVTGSDPFPHNIVFNELAELPGPNGSVRVRLCGMQLMNEPAIEVRVYGKQLQPYVDIAALERIPVGYYRVANTSVLIDRGVNEILLEGIVDNSAEYDIEIIVDKNHDYRFDAADDDAFIYRYGGESAGNCPMLPVGECLRGGPMNREAVPACRMGRDVLATLSGTHVRNDAETVDEAWVSLPTE